MASDKPIFISYASADIDAAQRIAAVLRESGIEARVGDKQGHDLKAEITGSTLFLAIVSAHAGEDSKDGFRHEWEIAAAHMDTLPRGGPVSASDHHR